MKNLFAKTLAIIIAVMLVVSAMPMTFAADEIASGTAGDGVNWVLDADGTLTISGEGEIVVDWYAPPWADYSLDIYSIVINEGISNVPSTAFCYAENLTSVSIPASVSDMRENNTNPFWDCFSLAEINVHPDNQWYTSVDGVVFNKEKTSLCYYPPNKAGSTYNIPASVTSLGSNSFNYTKNISSLMLPDSVTTIANDAFYGSYIKSITLNNNITVIPSGCFSYSAVENMVLSDSIETIEYGAFYGCGNLKNITFGSGVKAIADGVFDYCYELTTIHYKGTEAQWNEIEINEETEHLNNAAIHYVTDEMYKTGIDGDCENNGNTDGIYCEECEAYVTGNILFAPGHNYENGICTTCNEACTHQHYDFDDICDICGQDAPINAINVGETKSVYIKEGHSTNIIMFTATQSGLYILNSDINNSDIDPYVTLYDINKDVIDSNDDGGYGLNFELSFNAVAGESYYIELSSYDDDSTYDITLDKHFAFFVQPTAENPYVSFTWDNAAFQWCTISEQKSIISLDNAQAVSYKWGSSLYDTQNGWTGVRCNLDEDSSDYDFFTIPLKAGESITVELTGDYSSSVGLWDYSQNDGFWCDLTDDSTYTLTAENDGNYTFYTYSDTGNVTVKASCVNFAYNKINGQTDAELKNPVIGTKYACIATLDGESITSDVFEYTYFIAHQPTSTEPYVTLNEQAKDAKYQWYKSEEGIGEITDAEADPFDMGDSPAFYDAENGWTGYRDTIDGTSEFFYIELDEGESITVKANGNASEIYIYNPELSDYTQRSTPDENGEVTLTSVYSCSYILAATCDADTAIRAYGNTVINTELEDQTSANLTEFNIGTTYFCEVIVDDNLLVSNAFECEYAIIHQPTVSEPYVQLSDDTDATYQWWRVQEESENLIPLTGENDSTLKTTDAGYYICFVTFADGTSAKSEILDLNVILGDVNNDGSVNNKDLGVLMQHLNSWETVINTDAADVNADGKVNNKDYGLLMQYINDWDVTLG